MTENDGEDIFEEEGRGRGKRKREAESHEFPAMLLIPFLIPDICKDR